MKANKLLIKKIIKGGQFLTDRTKPKLMGKIYAVPQGLAGLKPQITHPFDAEAYGAAEARYVEAVRDWCRKNGNQGCAERGEKIRFQVADGYAVYVVVDLVPVKLIHLDIGDAYRFPYVNRLTAADVRKHIAQEKAWAKLWETKREEHNE